MGAIEIQKQVEKTLTDHGAVLVRQKKHKVWKFPDGRIFTTASTPSDHRAWMNILSDLNKVLQKQRARKTHLDFEHRKREDNYVKEHHVETELLAGLGTPVHQPQAPYSDSPLVWEKKKELDRKLDAQLEEREILEKQFEEVHMPSHARIIVRRVTGRSERGRALSPAMLAEAKIIYEARGEEALQEFLQNSRNVFGTQITKQEESEMVQTSEGI
jgi:hypothetical protein